jgi:hypothetical protein
VEDWPKKRDYLVSDVLPRRVSQGRSRFGISLIRNVKMLAQALGRNRTLMYETPSPELLSEIKYLYQIPEEGECRGEFEYGRFEDFRDEYRTLHDASACDPISTVPDGERIYQLDKKIDALVETMGDLEKINPRSRTNLAHFARIDPALLERICTTGTIPPSVATVLGECCRFDIDDCAWNDRLVAPEQKGPPNYQGRDTALAFRRYLRSLCKLELQPALLLKSLSIETLDPNLASFALSDLGQETQFDQSLCVFLQLDMTPGWAPSGYAYAFRKVRIRLIVDDDGGVDIRKRLGYPTAINIANAILQARGTVYEPFWELFIDDGVLEGEYSTRDQHLFEILRASQGLGFAAELSFQLFDGSLLRADNKPLVSRAKETIIERLMAKRITTDTPDQGWLVLGRQILQIAVSQRV